MKTRNGFVSNSSSSSFLVVFPKTPASIEETRELLFGKEKTYPGLWDGSGPFPTVSVAAAVFGDLQGQVPMPRDESIAHHLNEHMDGKFIKAYAKKNKPPRYPKEPKGIDWSADYKDYSKTPAYKKWEKLQQAYGLAFNKWAQKAIKEFLKKNPGVLYQFEYSDQDGSFRAAMEHGNLFEKLPFIRISHH